MYYLYIRVYFRFTGGFYFLTFLFWTAFYLQKIRSMVYLKASDPLPCLLQLSNRRGRLLPDLHAERPGLCGVIAHRKSSPPCRQADVKWVRTSSHTMTGRFNQLRYKIRFEDKGNFHDFNSVSAVPTCKIRIPKVSVLVCIHQNIWTLPMNLFVTFALYPYYPCVLSFILRLGAHVNIGASLIIQELNK